MQPVQKKLIIFIKEANEFLRIVNEERDLVKLKKYLKSTKYLFKESCGNKNFDFVFIKQ